MGLVTLPFPDFQSGDVISQAQVDANFSELTTKMNTYVPLTDVARTVTVGHTWTATQILTPASGFAFNITTGGFTAVGNSVLTGTLSGLTGITQASGTAALQAVTATTLTTSALATLHSLAISTGGITVTDGNLLLSSGQASDTEFNAGNTGGALTINWNNGATQRCTNNQASTLTFTNPVAHTRYVLTVVQGGTGSHTWGVAGGAWKAGAVAGPIFPGGAPPAVVGKAQTVIVEYLNGAYVISSVMDDYTP